MLAYAARRAPDRADDVVAETFAIAWRRVDETPEDAEPWPYCVARRVLAGYWCSESRQHALISRICKIAPVATGDEPDHEVLARLGDPDREALLLTYWEGLEPGRAAALLGISRDAPRSARRHRLDVRVDERSCPLLICTTKRTNLDHDQRISSRAQLAIKSEAATSAAHARCYQPSNNACEAEGFQFSDAGAARWCGGAGEYAGMALRFVYLAFCANRPLAATGAEGVESGRVV